ncbi:MAG: biopolymer transporter ExbD [bacterium]
MGGKEIGVRSDVFFTFYSLLSTSYFQEKTMHEGDIKRDDVMWEINITPLTDVFLVLLVIFMIATPLLIQSGVKVKLPSSTVTEAQSEGIIITVTKENKIYVGKEEISAENLLNYLKEKLETEKDKFVIINGDQDVLLGNAVKIMDLAKIAGAEKIAIATEPKKLKEL